jgi:hypothetical protein
VKVNPRQGKDAAPPGRLAKWMSVASEWSRIANRVDLITP